MKNLSDLLEELPVPDHSPGFWDALQAQLTDAPSTDDAIQREPDEGDLIMVDIQTRPTDTEQPADEDRRSWLPYTILAAAAALVVIVAVTIFDGAEETSPIDVVDNPDVVVTPEPDDSTTPDAGEGEAAPQPGVTEVEPEPVSETPVLDIGDDGRSLIEAFVANVNAGDADAVVSMLGMDAEFGSTLIDMQRSAMPVDELGDQVAGLFTLLGDLNAQISIDSCTAGPIQTECFGEYTDDVVAQVTGERTDAAFGCNGCSLHVLFAMDGPEAFSLLRVIVKPAVGAVGGYTRSLGGCVEPCRPTPWVTSAGYLEFLGWIDATYPDERALLMDDNVAYPIVAPGTDVDGNLVVGAFPRFTPEASALLVLRVAEWIAML